MGDTTPNEGATRLAAAIKDAYLLLEYLSSSNHRVDEGTVTALVEARQAIDTATFTQDMERNFWTAYDKLEVAASPVTVISLKDTAPIHLDIDSSCLAAVLRKARNWCLNLLGQTPPTPAPISKAYHTARRHRRGLLYWLAALIIVQLGWSMSLLITKDYHRLLDITLKCAAADAEAKARAEVAAPPSASQGKGRNKPAATDNNPAESKKECALSGARRAVHVLNTEFVARTMRVVTFSTKHDLMGPLRVDEAAFNRAAEKFGLSPGSLKRLRADIAAYHFLKLVFEPIEHYILPLLYGVLGAYIFVVRAMSDSIRARTYRHTDSTLYSQRLFLGAVAGVVVGWAASDPLGNDFFRAMGIDMGMPSGTGAESSGAPGSSPPSGSSPGSESKPDSNSGAGKIGPFALAFIAGYGVELLFSALDGFIRRFGPNGK